MNDSWANFFPYFAGAFKLIVLGIGAYLAIKWHFDEERRVREAQGVVFDKPSVTKKLAVMLTIPFLLSFLVLLVIYATDWFLY
ncbi:MULTISPECIES: hypothetical protein [unclassified Vibrio]|uniref:hypothetical protein n=1 Tax=unclassified Vibrio TaxID=2614977 RepID=UPI001361BE47|nr:MULTISPECIES: hypothetical protein [unclassified Vibrio]NAW56369.1 hypothetical protein [Vibrio sp. V36_P2S2PM302]NAX22182.1 hypothetical protein [Vibrio sp. V39_P1S14PM300]NAX27442.1 hypothetical protein [Vibrio sp. V38_P2S17PM301]NAX29421.1 hypothetical protein [Vibrio sp. V37_P2S8PM304]